MDDSQPVAIGRTGERLAFEDARLGTSVQVTLDVGNVHAVSRVDLRERFEIAEFFAELGATWSGWSGTRDWQSEHLDLTITCQHDGVREF